ncbi:MAG: hypothetical protein WC342_08575 [Methanoregula sp.]|jgi:hypothetical protein
MKLPDISSNRTASFLLLCTGAVLIALAILVPRDAMMAAALVITGGICFFSGIFVLTYSTEDSFAPRYAALLPVTQSITTTRIAADLGIVGNAYFLPQKFHAGSGVVLYVPVSGYDNLPVKGNRSFVVSGCGGMILSPSCNALLASLIEKQGLTIPSDSGGFDNLVKELAQDVLECSPALSVVREDDLVTVTMASYVLAVGCREIAKESPRCCIVSPCPVCSLFGVLLAESEKKPVELERCEISKKNDVTVLYRVLIPGTPSPRDEGPGNSG